MIIPLSKQRKSERASKRTGWDAAAHNSWIIPEFEHLSTNSVAGLRLNVTYLVCSHLIVSFSCFTTWFVGGHRKHLCIHHDIIFRVLVYRVISYICWRCERLFWCRRYLGLFAKGLHHVLLYSDMHDFPTHCELLLKAFITHNVLWTSLFDASSHACLLGLLQNAFLFAFLIIPCTYQSTDCILDCLMLSLLLCLHIWMLNIFLHYDFAETPPCASDLLAHCLLPQWWMCMSLLAAYDSQPGALFLSLGKSIVLCTSLVSSTFGPPVTTCFASCPVLNSFDW